MTNLDNDAVISIARTGIKNRPATFGHNKEIKRQILGTPNYFLSMTI